MESANHVSLSADKDTADSKNTERSLVWHLDNVTQVFPDNKFTVHLSLKLLPRRFETFSMRSARVVQDVCKSADKKTDCEWSSYNYEW